MFRVPWKRKPHKALGPFDMEDWFVATPMPKYKCQCGAVYDRERFLSVHGTCSQCLRQMPASYFGYIFRESDPHGTDPHAPGAKLDAGKNRVWLCLAGFSNALDKVAEVTTKGATKYTPNGWMEVPGGAERYMDAFGRHALKLGSGEAIDPDTGCQHKAQMIWNLLASFELELRNRG